MKIMKTVITLLGSIHPAMHTHRILSLHTCVQLKAGAGAVLQNPALQLFFSHAFENWSRFSKGDTFSLKKKKKKSQHFKMTIFLMAPLLGRQVSNETHENFPGSTHGILLCHLLVVPSFQVPLF